MTNLINNYQSHPFHLVSPSPRPLYCCIWLLATALFAIGFYYIIESKLKYYTKVFLIITLALVLLCIAMFIFGGYSLEMPIKDMPIPGVRCPTCAAKGQEVWVIPGKACGYCGTACG